MQRQSSLPGDPVGRLHCAARPTPPGVRAAKGSTAGRRLSPPDVGEGPSRLRRAVPLGPQRQAKRGRPPVRQRSHDEMLYTEAMLDGQFRQMMGAGIGGRPVRGQLPTSYRRLLLPSPSGMSRYGIAYEDLQVAEPERPSAWERLCRQVRHAWLRVRGYCEGMVLR